MERISSDQYRNSLNESSPCNERDKFCEALKYALETRKFEIELYWERAKYFWTFIAASLAAYGLVQKIEPKDIKEWLSILISCLGLVFSVGWYFVNRGSKYWQENWENHVALLEDKAIGPLFKTILMRHPSQMEGFKEKLIGPAPYSVSKINQLISLYIIFFWLILICKSLVNKIEFSHFTLSIKLSASHFYWFFFIISIFFCFLIWKWGKSDLPDHSERFDYLLIAKQFKIKIKDNDNN